MRYRRNRHPVYSVLALLALIGGLAATMPLFVVLLPALAQQPLQWSYSFDGTGTGLASYPGNASVGGNLAVTGNANVNGNLVVTGSTTFTPAAGSLTLNMLASQAANTVVANFTGSPGSPTAKAVPAATGSLRYTAGAGFVANAAGQQPATATNDNAGAGTVGEYMSSNIVQGSSVSLTSTVPKTITSLSLTAGDWDCQANAGFNPAGTTTVSSITGSISLTTNTLGATNEGTVQLNTTFGTGVVQTMATGPARVSLASTASVFLVESATFGTSTMGGYGFLRCRRVR